MIFAPLDTANISALRNVKNDFVRAKIIDSSDNPALIRDTARRYVDQEPPSLIKNTSQAGDLCISSGLPRLYQA